MWTFDQLQYSYSLHINFTFIRTQKHIAQEITYPLPKIYITIETSQITTIQVKMHRGKLFNEIIILLRPFII